MPIFKMLVGLPASGKSTYAEGMKEHGYLVFSSDTYRERTGSQDTAEIFDALHNEILESFRDGKDCILDATNLNRNKRVAFLNQVKETGARRDCELFVVPVSVCKERNRKRENNHGVNDEVIESMLRRFQTPWYTDGFDAIHVQAYKRYEMEYSRKELMEMSQDNPHHTLTVGEHEEKAVSYIEENCRHLHTFPLLCEAARYHDDGKLFTKSFLDGDGNVSDIAHFFYHENVGAFLFLVRAFCTDQYRSQEGHEFFAHNILYISNLICRHMRPHTAWAQSDRARAKDRRILGEEMYRDLSALAEADLYAK